MITATGSGNSGPGIGPNDGDGVNLIGVKRKKIPLILQQSDAFEGLLQCDGAALLAEARAFGIGLVGVEEAEANGGAEDAADLFVDGGLRDLSALDCWQ